MSLVWAGVVLSALLGLLHAAYVYRAVVNAASGTAARASAAYYAAWTLFLWVLLGAYVLILGLIAVIVYGGTRLLGRRD